MTRRHHRSSAALVALGLTLATAIAYAPVGGFGFVSYDDPEYVAANPRVKAGLSSEGARWAFTGVHHGTWHPLTTLSYMLEVELFGLDPGIQHRVNVALHVVNALLLFSLLLRMTGSLWRSAAVAALFTLHPLRVESVAWISGRKDLICTGFALAATHAYVDWVRGSRPGRYVAVLLLFALGLMAKPMLVTWPFVLLLLDVWPLGRFETRTRPPRAAGIAERASRLRRALLEKAPMLILAGISSALTVWAQRTAGALKSVPLNPLDARIANALLSYVAYLRRAVWPTDLSVLYPFPDSFTAWQVAASAGLLAAITWGCLRLRKRRPYALVGWLWYLGTLVPVIGIVQVGAQASADRYTYIPLIGICVAVVWGLADALERLPQLRLPAAGLGVGVLTLLAILTARQVEVWEDSVRLYRHGIRVTERNAVLHNNLGIALADQGRFEEAIGSYEEGLAFPSPFVHTLHYNAAIALARSGRHEEALAHLDQTLRLVPDDAATLFHRAKSLAALGRLAEARRDLERVVELAPEEADPHVELGIVLGKLGDLPGATRHLSRAVELQPLRIDARVNLAIAQLKAGNAEAAARELEAVLQIDPGHEAARHYLELARPEPPPARSSSP